MRLSAALLLLATTACSGGSDGGTVASSGGPSSSGGSSSSGGGVVTTTAPAALSAYCTGQSLVELTLLEAVSAQAWAGDGNKVPVGSTIYLAYDFGEWEGYVILADGTPGKLHSGAADSKLVEGTHYSGSCPQPGPDRRAVTLRDAHVFATKELTGTECVLPIGTELPDYGYASQGTNVGSIRSSAVTNACGYETGFTKDLAMAPLAKK